MGKADHYEPDDHNAVCFECGRKFKASMLRKHWQGYWVCPEHWETRHTQDFVRNVPDTMATPWAQPIPDASFNTVATAISVSSSYTVASPYKTVYATNVGANGALVITLASAVATVLGGVVTVSASGTGNVLVNLGAPGATSSTVNLGAVVSFTFAGGAWTIHTLFS